MEPKNLHNPPEHVNFYKLLPHDASFKSVCPFCEKGILVVYRDPDTCEVLENDRCLLCGQHVIDIELMRKLHGRNEAFIAETN